MATTSRATGDLKSSKFLSSQTPRGRVAKASRAPVDVGSWLSLWAAAVAVGAAAPLQK